MKTRDEIRALRSGLGYFTAEKMADAMTKKGIELSGNDGYHISRQSYWSREVGKIPFSKFEIEVLSAVLGISYKKALEYFF